MYIFNVYILCSTQCVKTSGMRRSKDKLFIRKINYYLSFERLIPELTQQEDFAQFARNFRATNTNIRSLLIIILVARKFRANCVKFSCRACLNTYKYQYKII